MYLLVPLLDLVYEKLKFDSIETIPYVRHQVSYNSAAMLRKFQRAANLVDLPRPGRLLSASNKNKGVDVLFNIKIMKKLKFRNIKSTIFENAPLLGIQILMPPST